MQLKNSVFILIFVLFVFSCKRNSDVKSGVSAGFDQFYQQFHADSLYQMQHIDFPLRGIPAAADSVQMNSNFEWTAEEWEMQKIIPDTLGFIHKFESVDHDLVKEFIIQPNNIFALERRFYFRDGDWHLIYYAAMNKIK
jgi:hypothetical protein